MEIVKFLKNSASDESNVRCEYCKKVIAKNSEVGLTPSFEDCYKMGNVPIPNFGWLCSQECAIKFEEKNDIKFGRTKDGIVDYYFGEL